VKTLTTLAALVIMASIADRANAETHLAASIHANFAVTETATKQLVVFVRVAPFGVDRAPSRSVTKASRSPGERVTLGILGAVAGFFAGAFLGYELDRHVITPHGGGDDPGMKGFLVGGLTGAIVAPTLMLKLIY